MSDQYTDLHGALENLSSRSLRLDNRSVKVLVSRIFRPTLGSSGRFHGVESGCCSRLGKDWRGGVGFR